MYVSRGLKIKNIKNKIQIKESIAVRYKEISRISKSQVVNIYWNTILCIDQSSILIIPNNHFFISLFSRLPYIRLTCKNKNIAFTFCPKNIDFLDSKNQIVIKFDSFNREYEVSLKTKAGDYEDRKSTR